MGQFTIHFEAESLHRSRLGSVTGIVFFDFGKRQFPGQGWSDFAVIVSLWWMQALEALESQGTTTKFRFMDGPYWIQARSDEAGNWVIECIEDRRSEVVVLTSIVDSLRFADEIRRLAIDVLAACQRRGWESNDLVELAKRVKSS